MSAKPSNRPGGSPCRSHVKEAGAERHDGDEEGRYEVGHHLGEELPPHRYLHLDALLAWLPEMIPLFRCDSNLLVTRWQFTVTNGIVAGILLRL